VKKTRYPDEGLFPDSKGGALDKAGIQDTGYLDKKGAPQAPRVTPTEFIGERLNRLPPGTDIEDQWVSQAETSAKRLSKVKQVDEIGYEGDGWQSKP